MIFTIPKLRGTDAQGSGAYGASRGKRTHKGVDYACRPGAKVYSAVEGLVTRLGYPYKDNKDLRLIEIEAENETASLAIGLDALVRYMYIDPTVKKGDWVEVGTLLGKCQKLTYKGITQHVHVDVRVVPPGKKRRQFVNPVEYFERES